eukprot:819732_1
MNSNSMKHKWACILLYYLSLSLSYLTACCRSNNVNTTGSPLYFTSNRYRFALSDILNKPKTHLHLHDDNISITIYDSLSFLIDDDLIHFFDDNAFDEVSICYKVNTSSQYRRRMKDDEDQQRFTLLVNDMQYFDDDELELFLNELAAIDEGQRQMILDQMGWPDWNEWGDRFKNGWDNTKEFGNNAWQNSKQWGSGAVDKTKEFGSNAFDKTKQFGGDMWDKTREHAPNAWDTTKQWGSNAFDKTKEFGGNAFDKTKQFGGNAWDKTREHVPQAWQNTKQWSDNAFDKTKQFGGDMWDKTREHAPNAWDRTKQFGNNAFDKSKEFGGDMWDKTKEHAPQAWDRTKQFAGNAWDKTKDAWRSMWHHEHPQYEYNVHQHYNIYHGQSPDHEYHAQPPYEHPVSREQPPGHGSYQYHDQSQGYEGNVPGHGSSAVSAPPTYHNHEESHGYASYPHHEPPSGSGGVSHSTLEGWKERDANMNRMHKQIESEKLKENELEKEQNEVLMNRMQHKMTEIHTTASEHLHLPHHLNNMKHEILSQMKDGFQKNDERSSLLQKIDDIKHQQNALNLEHKLFEERRKQREELKKNTNALKREQNEWQYKREKHRQRRRRETERLLRKRVRLRAEEHEQFMDELMSGLKGFLNEYKKGNKPQSEKGEAVPLAPPVPPMPSDIRSMFKDGFMKRRVLSADDGAQYVSKCVLHNQFKLCIECDVARNMIGLDVITATTNARNISGNLVNYEYAIDNKCVALHVLPFDVCFEEAHHDFVIYFDHFEGEDVDEEEQFESFEIEWMNNGLWNEIIDFGNSKSVQKCVNIGTHQVCLTHDGNRVCVIELKLKI